MILAREQYSNAIATQLNGAINSSTTTVVVDDASSFPVSFFRIIIESEIMYVTLKSSNTLTVIRAYEGTSGASHADNTPVNHVLTAGALTAMRTDAMRDAGVLPEAAPISSDDDYFDDNSFTGWTKVWSGSAPTVTETEVNRNLNLLHSGGGAAGQYLAWMKAKTPSHLDYIQCGIQYFQGQQDGYFLFALMMSDGVTYGSGNQVAFECSPREGSMNARPMTGYNSNSGQTNWTLYPQAGGGTLHMRFVWNQQNMDTNNSFGFYISADGNNWQLVKDPQTAGSGWTPTYMGFGVCAWASSLPPSWNLKYIKYSF